MPACLALPSPARQAIERLARNAVETVTGGFIKRPWGVIRHPGTNHGSLARGLDNASTIGQALPLRIPSLPQSGRTFAGTRSGNCKGANVNPWIILSLSVMAEVAGEVCMRMSHGFSRPGWIAGLAVFYGLSFWGAAVVMKYIDMSVTYAIWSGAGTALVAIVGAMLFGESMTLARLSGLALIVGGVAVLHLDTTVH